MPSLSMNGPYKLDKETIDAKITRTSPGNYALGEKNEKGTFLVDYVGRSDDDVNGRLKDWVSKTKEPLFKFSYATSPKAAFEKECNNCHHQWTMITCVFWRIYNFHLAQHLHIISS